MRHLVALAGIGVLVGSSITTAARGSDVASSQLLAATLQSPTRLAWAGPELLAVADYGAQRIVTVNAATLELVDSFSIAGRPVAVAFDGTHILVGNETAGTDAGEPGLISFDFPIAQSWNFSWIDPFTSSSQAFYLNASQVRGFCYLTCHDKDHSPENYDRGGGQSPALKCSDCH